MAWDDKLISDINNALKQQGKQGAAPAPAQPAQKKPMDMSAIEASIQASIRGTKPQTPPPATPAPKPAPAPAPAPAPEPAPAQPAQKPMDMSAIEAAIQASVQGGKKSDSAPEPAAPAAVVPEVMPKAAPQPEPETPRPAKGEIVLEPVRDEEPAPAPAPETEPGQPSKADLEAMLIATLAGMETKQTADTGEEEPPAEVPAVQPEPEPEPEPEPKVSQEEITRMAFAHEPQDVGSMDAVKMFREAAGRIPGYLPGMRVEDAVTRADAQALESSIRESDTDTLLVLYKFLSVEIEYARDESVVTGLQSLVLDVLYQRLNEE